MLTTIFLLLAAILTVAYLLTPIFIWRLSARVKRLEGELLRLTAAAPPAPTPPIEAAAAIPDEPAAPEPAPEPPPQAAQETPQKPAAPARPRRRDFEEALARRWFVWIGGGALAFSGLFLVKYSIEEGLLGPEARLLLGLLLALLLIGAAEWTRRRGDAYRPDFVPQALGAGAIFTAYATIYAAHALYGLIGPALAFIGLGIVSFLAFGAAILFGPFVALLGMVGGYLTPALVATGEPEPLALFGYLALLTAAAQCTVRAAGRWWLGWSALGLSMGWALVWLGSAYNPQGATEIALYIPCLALLFGYVRWRPAPEARADHPFRFWKLKAPDLLGLAAGIAALAISGSVAGWTDFATLSIFSFGATLLAILVLARREPEFDLLVLAGLAILLLVLAAWKGGELEPFGQVPPDLLSSPIAPLPRDAGQDLGFLAASSLFALILGLCGYAALWGARRPWIWALVSAAGAAGPLQLAFHSAAYLASPLVWALAALLLAALFASAAARINQFRDRPALKAALAAYILAGLYCCALVALIILGFEAWRVALAVLVPAIAYVETRLALPPLRRVALGLSLALLAWLATVAILFESAWRPLIFHAAYQFAVPAICYFAAARLLERSRRDAATEFIALGAYLQCALFLALLVRIFVHGLEAADSTRSYALFEASLHSLVWLGLAYAMYRARLPGWAARWSWRLLVSLAVLSILVVQLTGESPAYTNAPVGEWPLVNVLALTYLLPGLLFGLLARQAAARGSPRWAKAGFAAMLFLLWVYLSFEVRRAFRGSMLAVGPTGLAEIYAYSAAWALFAAAILGLGILRRQKALRLTGLGLIGLVVCKVFVYDMAELTGLWRAASFLGLGLGLVALGLVYRRLDLIRAAEGPDRRAAP